MESATPYILFFCGVGILGSFIIGVMLGWFGNDLVYAFLNKNRPQQDIHPEFFDENGNLLPDEILAVRFNPDDFDDDEDEDDED